MTPAKMSPSTAPSFAPHPADYVLQLSKLAFVSHDRPFCPLLIVHRVKCQSQVHVLSSRAKLHQSRDIIWFNARNKISQVDVREPLLRDHFGVVDSPLGR